MRIFCIGKNYADHAREMSEEVPESPVVFMKPNTCLVEEGAVIEFPEHGSDLHYEAELVVLVGKDGRPKAAGESHDFIAGLSLGLDMTMRDVQKELKSKGLPWELSKAFDQSAPVGRFIEYDEKTDLSDIRFSCRINGELRQEGHTRLMIFSVPELIAALSKVWRLKKGDLIFTGTPAGIGSVKPGDVISLQSDQIGTFSWKIARQLHRND